MIRPLENIIGHQASRAQLDRMLQRQAVPHALLFAGPEGIGKRTTARAFAAALLTAGGTDPRTEEKLRLLFSGNHPDLHLVVKDVEKKDLPVDLIRSLCNALRLKPYYSSCEVTVIDNAHEMSLAAANAMLMTLEEPAKDSYLVLVTHAPQRLPETIISRCQSVHFGELSENELQALLKRVLPQDLGSKEQLALFSLCSGSLAALQLAPFVHPLTLLLGDSSDLTAHLDTLITKTARIKQDLENLIQQTGAGTLTAQHALSVASTLSADSDDLALHWRILNQLLRAKLRAGVKSQTGFWAAALARSLAAEKLTFERNTSPQLQLSSLLLAGVEHP